MVGTRAKRSPVWAHFTAKENGGVCIHCKTFCNGKGGNTSNLIKHLRLKHNLELKKCTMFDVPSKTSNDDSQPSCSGSKDDSTPPTSTASQSEPSLPSLKEGSMSSSVTQPKKSTQLTLTSMTAEAKKPKLTSEQSDAIGRSITRYIVKEMLPFSTIASEPFRSVLKALNPSYVPPNKETLSSIYIPSWYKVEVDLLRQDLEATSSVGITADHWTSLGGDHYITVTGHFIKDWSLCNKVLETRAVYEAQTGEAIASEIKDCLTKFSITDKVVAITVDNAANMASGANTLNIMRLPCFAHSMNISAGKLYNEPTFTRWLARIRAVVVWFKRVHLAGVVLKEKLAALELPNHSVILDVKTRWNSMYLMVERFAEIYLGLSAACRDPRLKKRVDKEKVERISDADLKKAEEFTECMKVLYTSTLAISTDKLPTAGQVLPMWRKLQKCFSPQDDDSEFVRNVKATVWNDMKKRYQQPDTDAFLEEATALDPRFKAKLPENCNVWSRLENKIADMIQSERVAVVQQIHVKQEQEDAVASELPATDSVDAEAPESSDVSVVEEEPSLKRKRSAIEDLFADDDDDVVFTRHDEAPPPAVQAHLEIEHYRSCPGVKLNGDPLLFYKEHQARFQHVTLLAVKYLCVPGSSVPSERVFSLAGNTISQERVRLDPEKADMLIFLHKNTQ